MIVSDYVQNPEKLKQYILDSHLVNILYQAAVSEPETAANTLRNAKKILNEGANINVRFNEGPFPFTPLIWVLRFDPKPNGEKVFIWILENGADVNQEARDHQDAPLLAAVDLNDEDKALRRIKILIEKGANPLVKDCHNCCALDRIQWNSKIISKK